MKLQEFNSNAAASAKKALKEHFGTTFNVEKLGLFETKTMLSKVKNLLNEQKISGAATEKNPSYMKLVFMEQTLVHHYGELKTLPMYNPRIVVENEEVEKSQVVLAAQEMVDSIQKMVEEVSDMLVKELPAVVDGVNSEFGTTEGEQFNGQVAEALTSLQAALTQSKTGLQGALGTITGQGASFDAEPTDMTGNMTDTEPTDMDAEMPDSGDETELASLEEPEEEELIGTIGRSKR